VPSSLPGEARDLIIDVHNSHLKHRGGFETSAILHSHDKLEAVRETFQGQNQALLGRLK
jgi:hypothetical protein